MPFLEDSEVEAHCPECNTPFTIKLVQVANEEIVTCTGCHKIIQLKDKDGTMNKGLKDVDNAIRKLKDSIKDINLKF